VRHGEAHDKEKQLTAPAPNSVLRPLPCAAKKRTAIFCLCRAPWYKTHGNLLPLPCAALKNARQSSTFVTHRGEKRTTINDSFVVRCNKTRDKGTISAGGFGHFVVRLPKNARQSDLCN
jgi:hypothetical protein